MHCVLFPRSMALPPIRSPLLPLVEEAWRLYRETNAPSVVRPSIPILYFGDAEAYAASPLRVITVGLNPSRVEFPERDPFQRFPGAASLDASKPDAPAYLGALDGYFRAEPYARWFSSFEPILRGIGASYYGRTPSTALHTDLLSPLATDPTWSKLGKQERGALARDGVALWHGLARALRPHVILVSVAREHLGLLRFPVEEAAAPLHVVERSNPYHVEGWRVGLGDGHGALLAFGRAAQKPFGLVSDVEKERVGASVRASVRREGRGGAAAPGRPDHRA